MKPETRPEELRILHLEDNPMDVELLSATLAEAGVPCKVTRVDTESDFVRSLETGAFDLIVSDFSLPGFDGRAALEFARVSRPDLPFIFVSGTIGEDAAIDSLTSGATDYVLKHKFSRLVPAVNRARSEAREKRLRAESEARLRASEDKYRRLFEESKDAIFILATDNSFVDINPAGAELLGYADRKALLASGPLSGLYEDTDTRGACLERMAKDGYVRDCELKLKHRDGSVLTVLETSSPVVDESGKTVAYRGIWRDVTEQRKVEAQFLRAQRVESIGMLAGGIAHDLNNILSPILMAIPLLKSRNKDVRDNRTLDTIERSAQRGAALVKQVLTFARGASSQRGPLELKHLVRDVEKILRETFPKSIRIEVRLPKDLWGVIGDGTQLHQVLMNLAVNARDAMPSGGVLRIAARNLTLEKELTLNGLTCAPGPFVAVEVGDTGEGIPEELKNNIFDAFFTTKEAGRGTGLGLSTVHSVARNHGGTVALKSQVGKGTTFTVYVAASPFVSEGAPVEAETATQGNGEVVLIVDDEVAIRDIARETLESHGYRVLEAADGEEGLRTFLLHQDHISAIVTDFGMPRMNGHEMAGSIERAKPGTPVAFMSGDASFQGTAWQAEAERAGLFIPKPFAGDRLLEAVARLLGKS